MDGDSLFQRLRHFAPGLEGLARPETLQPVLTWACVALLVWAGWGAYRAGAFGRLSGAWGRLRDASPGVRLIAWTAAAYTLLAGALYLGHLSPAHAVGGRYNAALWPLLALLLAGGARALGPGRAAIPLLAMAAGLLTYQAAGRMDASQVRLVRSPAWQALASAQLVVADHAQRGVLPRSVLHLPADTPVRVVSDPAMVDWLLRASRSRRVPVTFLLSAESGDPRVRLALENARLAGDSLRSAGYGPAGTEVVLWTPGEVRSGAGAGR